MVDAWEVAVFVAGLALVAVELAYPRRYLGVIGVSTTVVGLLAMFLPDTLDAPVRIVALGVAGAATALLAVPFYRRYAPHVGPMATPDVVAGGSGRVVQPILPPGEGLVEAGGVLWTATADAEIPAGTRVRILVIESDRLWVEADLDAPPDEGDAQ